MHTDGSDVHALQRVVDDDRVDDVLCSSVAVTPEDFPPLTRVEWTYEKRKTRFGAKHFSCLP